MIKASILRGALLEKIFLSEKNRYSRDFKSWISSGDYLVDAIVSDREFRLAINNYNSFSHCMFFDASRLGAVSFETINSIEPISNLPKAFAWGGIKAYYASFFAAHSIMRCCGYLCAQLEQGHVDYITTLAKVRGIIPPKPLSGGHYAGRYDATNQTLTLKLIKNTHEDTWKTFLDCVNSLSTKVLTLPGLDQEKQAAAAYLSQLSYELTEKGKLPKGNWLSSIRNGINYRQEHGAWFPYQGTGDPFSKFDKIIECWNKSTVSRVNGEKKSEKMRDFFWLSTSIVNLCFSIISDIAENSSNRRNSFKEKPIALLNFLNAS
jgi:hypothetical protein